MRTMAGSSPILPSARTASRPAPGWRAQAASLRSPEHMARIHAAGAVVHQALTAAAEVCQPGVSTREVDQVISRILLDCGAIPLFRNHAGTDGGPLFPADSCISVNEEVIHGIPGSRQLASGDVVSLDAAAGLNGWCADAAITVLIGDVEADIRRLAQEADDLLHEAIEAMTPGRRWSDIALRMHERVTAAGFSLAERFAGHGIGRDLHEPPSVPCQVDQEFLKYHDFTLRPGMVLAIEPILTIGRPALQLLPDGWTVVTADGSPSVHVEHTVAITNRGPRILTDGSVAAGLS
jgi:methionyl aminopeptidase